MIQVTDYRPAGGICDNCGIRKATSFWSGNRSPSDAIRQMHSLPRWCDYCAAVEQLHNIKESMERIPELERVIKEDILSSY